MSVVIPFFNEEDAVGDLLEEVRTAMDALGEPYEVIAVDDASRDRTAEILDDDAKRDPRLRILRLPRNRGQAAALYLGLHAARGATVVTLDGDGQNDPADIPRLLDRLSGADMVVGVRRQRSDSWLRRRMSRVSNRVRGRLLGDGMSDSGCALKVFRRQVVDAFIPVSTLYSFMPALTVAAGFRVAEREVSHRPRQGGDSSYGLRAMLWKPALDMLGIWWFSRRSFTGYWALTSHFEIGVRPELSVPGSAGAEPPLRVQPKP